MNRTVKQILLASPAMVMLAKYPRLPLETNDNGRISRAMGFAVLSGRHLKIQGNYTVDEPVEIPAGITITGNGKIMMTDNEADALLILGGWDEGDEGANINISDIEVVGGRFCLQVYGKDFLFHPRHITIKGLKTSGAIAGGIYVNSATDINILNCVNDGGFRHVGIESPLADKRVCKRILISGCRTENTTQFGYQLYYGEDMTVVGNYCDGLLMTDGDKSGVTVDRTNNVVVSGNTMVNCPEHQIFITGAEQVTASGNTCTGGVYGIQVAYNFESDEDAAITVSRYIELNNNNCIGNDIGIILNGVQDCELNGNTMEDSEDYSFYMLSQMRDDDQFMETKNITLIDNVGDSIYKNVNVTEGVVLEDNTFSEYQHP